MADAPAGTPPPAPAAPAVDLAATVRQRRESAGYAGDDLEAPPWGLALSGGGVRSATFCLGFVRALAGNGVFRRLDYLSTVSGGGYLGAAIGRLYDGKELRDPADPANPDKTKPWSAADAEKLLARKDTLLLWWLRGNGRYLTPAGARDLTQGFASILRGVLCTHFEVGMLLMLASAVMLLPYLLLRMAPLPEGWAAYLANFQPAGGSVWLWLLAVPVVLGAHHIFSYWFIRTPERSVVVDGIVSVLCALVGLGWGVTVVGDFLSGPPARLVAALVSATACLVLLTPATAFAARWHRREEGVSGARLRHTKGLAWCLGLALVLAVVGVVDWASWVLARVAGGPGAWQQQLLAAAPPVLVAAARWALPILKKWIEKMKASRKEPVKTEKLLNAVGIAVLFLIALAWATLFQFAAGPLHWSWLERAVPTGRNDLVFDSARWAILLIAPLAYVWFTRRNLELLNLSSLHNFYRARIERAYVACGNRGRFAPGALARANRGSTKDLRGLREAVAGDDVDVADYRPHAHGGPIHIINCCINQTVDDRTQNYNADRKGVALAVSSFGAETGTQLPHPRRVEGRLSTWIAISGAAASSGMGSQTSPGLAALLFLSGLRLGYWQVSLNEAASTQVTWRPALIRAEALAQFPGLRSPQWYLSDGGHFENTGVYALLKRQVRLIVVADCGADPEYGYADLENLVRKAQIDYGADIRFIAPPAASAPEAQPEVPMTDDERLLRAEQLRVDQALRPVIGLPEEVGKPPGAPFLLLARITYADGSTGTLVVAKPRRVEQMMLDLSCYARRNEQFPQQTTGDQFFDEEQWEAYHQLGVHLGRHLTLANLQRLQAWAEPAQPATRPDPARVNPPA